jgi:uncharacterized protein (DUF1684 family)
MGKSTPRRVTLGAFAAIVALCGTLATIQAKPIADTTYRASVEKWRQAYEADLKSDHGWLSVSGLFWLHDGENTFGSGPLNDIVLPASAPAKAGSFEFHAGHTTVHVNSGISALLNGKHVDSAEMHPDSNSDQLTLGDLTLYVHSSGERFTIRLRDKNSALRKTFTGTRWFPVDETYRVIGKFVPFDQPKPTQIQNVMGDTLNDPMLGYISFQLGGKDLRLISDAASGEVELVFRDLTSGHETYAASRFLDTKIESGGRVILDFNQAYNPPCAYNPYTTCPLPPPENRLDTRIEAGEKTYHHPAGAPAH